MAFIVEDGSGIANANSYATVAFADSYFIDRAVFAWAGSDAVKQSALILATDYVENVFGGRLLGTKKTAQQGLHFPVTEGYYRDGTQIPDNIVPIQLQRAIVLYAVRALKAPLLPDPIVDPSGHTVVTTKKTVGPIEKEFTVIGTSGDKILIRSYPEADTLLSAVLSQSYSNGTVIR